MARSPSSLRSLCVLGRRVFCTETVPTAESVHTLPFLSKRLQTLSAGLHLHARSAPHQTALCPASGVQHLLGTSFAASSLQQSRHPVPIISLVQLLTQRMPHQITVLQYDSDEDTLPSKPQSIGSIAKYGDEDIHLTETIILTPTREVHKYIVPPSVVMPLRADSVRRKRKHKMNKHKHKKRRKLQRHKN